MANTTSWDTLTVLIEIKKLKPLLIPQGFNSGCLGLQTSLVPMLEEKWIVRRIDNTAFCFELFIKSGKW
jgi:hypothetical protein